MEENVEFRKEEDDGEREEEIEEAAMNMLYVLKGTCAWIF